MKNFILIAAFLVGCVGYSQSDSEIKFYIHASETIPQKWTYFNLNETIEVKIVQHIAAKFHCGTQATASMTIVETQNGETIRVLDLCNLSTNYKVNQVVKVSPQRKPKFAVSLPFEFERNEKTNEIQSVSKNYDSRILKTTYGSLEN